MIKKIFKHLRAKVFAGILVILPLGITFLVLKFVFNALDSILDPLTPKVSIYLFQRDISIRGLGVVGFFLLLYLIGVITTNVLGRKLVNWTDKLFVHIPVVKNIYSSSKQLTDAFSTTKKGSFRQAVFVEFPQEGNFVLGFITNELTDIENEEKNTVFIPTGFAPPTGHLLFLPNDKVAVGRERPNGQDNKSFPSGHTSNAFVLASVAERHYGWRLGVPAYLLAGLVGASRLEQDKHYWSDVVAGEALGYIVGRTVVRVNGRPVEGDSHRKAALSVAPMVTRRTRGVQLSVVF